MTAWVLVAVSIVCSLPFVVPRRGPTRAPLARLAQRAVKRRGQTVLVLAGVVIATAVVTSAGVVGDSLRASVRRSAVTQLGPVDEEVLTTGVAAGRAVRVGDRSIAGRPRGRARSRCSASRPRSSGETSSPGSRRRRCSKSTSRGRRRFGGDPAATGISGATPTRQPRRDRRRSRRLDRRSRPATA